VAALDDPPRMTRARAFAAGDFTPHRRIVVQFDSVRPDGGELPMRTVVTTASERVTLQVAGTDEHPGIAARARREVAQRTSEAFGVLKAPGKMERLKQAAIDRLPYHPQFLQKGMVYTAELLAPLDFGTTPATPHAPPGTKPAPASILNARLVTALDSANTEKGTEVRAVVTRPVFSAAHELIFPEGTLLTGEVTLTRPARRFHRNGRLRFLFETVHLPDEDPAALLASLYAVSVSEDAHVAVDEEGGASVKNSNSRFVAPALAVLALGASTDRGHHGVDHDADDAPGAAAVQPGGQYGSRALGGFFGWGLLGVAASQISRPVGIALGAVGVARTVYTSVLGKGQEVSFPADTPIQVQLAPGRSAGQ
jgi:hypothetical protein